MIIVPIHARGRMLGVATFARTEHPAPFEEDDMLLAEELVARAALNLDNANRYTREHDVALALQRTLLPHHLKGGSAVEVASRYLPDDHHHGVGGDWFDVIPLSGARVALVVGDVVGHGINAAATMGRLRTAIHAFADLEMPPTNCSPNSTIWSSASPRKTPAPRARPPRSWAPPVCTRSTTRSRDGARWHGQATPTRDHRPSRPDHLP